MLPRAHVVPRPLKCNYLNVFFLAWEAASTAVLYHLTAPGGKRRLGVVPRPITSISVSDDLKRAVVYTEDYFGDAWISRVVGR